MAEKIAGTPRPAGWDAATIYRWFHEGKDVSQTTHPTSEQWRKIGEKYDAIKQMVDGSVRKHQGSWEGRAADAAGAAMSPLAAWAEEAKRVTEGVASRVGDQGSAFVDTKHRVEKPQDLPDKPFLNDYKPWTTDYDKAVSASKAVEAKNRQAVETYGTVTQHNVSTLPTFTPPPSINSNVSTSDLRQVDPGYRDHNVDSTRDVTRTTSVDRQSSDRFAPVDPRSVRPIGPPPPGPAVVDPPPARTDPSWGKPGQGGTDPGWRPGDHGGVRPPYPGPTPPTPVLPPGGGLRNPGGIPPRTPIRGGLPGQNPQGYPGGPGGGGRGLPGGGPGAGFGPRGSAGFGPGGLGGPGQAGPLGPGGSTGAGNFPSTARPLGMPEGNPANRGGPGMAGAPGAGAGRKEEDKEHQRPDYLLEDPDVYGDDRKVAPPVIGEFPPRN